MLALLIISFFYRTFIQAHCRLLKQSDLVEKLEDSLFHPRQNHPEKYQKTKKVVGLNITYNFKQDRR